MQLYIIEAIVSSKEKIPVYAQYNMIVEVSDDNTLKDNIVKCYEGAVNQFRRMRGKYPFIARHHDDDWFNENVGKLFSADICAINRISNCISNKGIYKLLYSLGYDGTYDNFKQDCGYSYLSTLNEEARLNIFAKISSANKISYDIYGNEIGKYYRISNYGEWLRYDGRQKYEVGTKLIHNGNGLKCTVVHNYEPFTIIGWDSRCCAVYYPELDTCEYEDVSNFIKDE